MIFLFPKILILSNQKFLVCWVTFPFFLPKLSVQTNKHVNLLDMSTAWKRLGIFFSLWIAIMKQKVLHTWIELQAQGALTWKWGTDMYEWPEDPLFMIIVPSWQFTRPPFHHVLVLKTLFSASITNFKKFKTLKPKNRGNTQFRSLKSGQNSVHKATFCSEI